MSPQPPGASAVVPADDECDDNLTRYTAVLVYTGIYGTRFRAYRYLSIYYIYCAVYTVFEYDYYKRWRWYIRV